MLRFPRALWIAALLAVVLSLPALFADFYCDDQVMVLRLEGTMPTPVPGPFHLYTFATGNAGERQLLVNDLGLPWWTVDGLRLSFFRPLSSALFALDHALAGRNPLPYHLHSMAWYVVAVLTAGMLLRRLLPEREAALAAILFAMAPAHWMLAAWPSARHVAVSGVLAIAAVALHLRGRTLAAMACAALGLAAGETALGAFAYVVAYEFIGRRTSTGERLRSLAPWGALFVAYAAMYKGLGFGARESGAYVDPIGQLGTYLAHLPARLAVYAEAALVGAPSELTSLAPRATPVLAAVGVVAAAVLALLFRRAVRSLEPEVRRTLAWLLTGAVLAVLPGAAGIPGDRILFLPNLGIVSALAIVLLRAGAGLPARAGVAVFGVLHVLVAPVLFVFGAQQLASSSHAARAVAARAEIPVGEGASVVGIGLSDPLVGMYVAGALLLAHPESLPRPVHLLTMSPYEHRVKRLDAKTLEIAVVGGTVLDHALEFVVRAPDRPLHAGDLVPLGAWIVRVLEDTDGRPTRFSVTFDRPLDDPALAFIVWRDGGLRAFSPPPVGQEVTVKHELGPMGL